MEIVDLYEGNEPILTIEEAIRNVKDLGCWFCDSPTSVNVEFVGTSKNGDLIYDQTQFDLWSDDKEMELIGLWESQKEELQAHGVLSVEPLGFIEGGTYELMITLDAVPSQWIYCMTFETSADSALKEYQKKCRAIGINLDNIQIMEAVLRDEHGNEMDRI